MKPNSLMLIDAKLWSWTASARQVIDEGEPQASNFFYLTGHENKFCSMLLIRQGNTKNDKYQQIIFCPEPSERAKVWTGALLSAQATARKLGFNQGLPLSAFEDFIKKILLSGIQNIYYQVGHKPQIDQKITDLLHSLNALGLRKGIEVPQHLISSEEIFMSQRIIKDNEEIAMIKKAAKITAVGHNSIAERMIDRSEAIEGTKPFAYEYEAEAELIYNYRRHNAIHAFHPIVAAGPNACVLHYTNNNQRIKAPDGLLVDSGAMFGHYAADMTRSYPPDRRQASYKHYVRVYNAVLRTHKKLCSSVRLGMTLQQLHQRTIRYILDELVAMKVLKKSSNNIEDGSYMKYFPHLTSHWIGLEVHDAGVYLNQKLKAGMVFSIEPGLYFAEDDTSVPTKWRGIGVRIEDTILMTSKGPVNLTSDTPYWQEV